MLLTDYISMYFAMALFLFYYLFVLGRHGWVLSSAMALVLPSWMYLFFDITMTRTLPKGVLAIEDAVVDGEAAASRATCAIGSEIMVRPPAISRVVEENCDGCAYCVEPCPTRSITLLEFMFRINGLEIVDIEMNAVKPRQYFLAPLVWFMRLVAFFASGKAWHRHRYDLTLHPKLILDRNNLIFITRKA